DVPTARPDTDSIAAGSFGPATGNVITDAEGDGGKDTVGADNAHVSAVASNNLPANSDNTADAGNNFQVDGQYGKLTIDEDGTYSYTRNAGTPGGVSDQFTYTLTDGDGDSSQTTLTISIGDNVPTLHVPTGEEAGHVVFEKGLPARGGEPEGSGEEAAPGPNGDPSETTNGTITFTQGDGPAVVTIGGIAVSGGETIAGASGTLTIDSVSAGSVSYHYTLTDNTSGDNTHDDFAVVVTDTDGDKATGTLVINIVDDVPTARPDTDSIAAGSFGPATGNVITDAEGDGGKDTVGADNAHVSAVSSNNVPANSDNTADAGNNFQVDGQYGKLTINEDGSYSYTRNAGTPGGVSDQFTYTLTDGDGDTSQTTLTISIGDNTPTLHVPTGDEAGHVVNEKGLPARGGEPEGSGEEAAPGANGDPSETTAGTITFTQGDGPATVTIGGVAVTAVGQTFTGSFGTLTIDSIGAGTIGYHYTLADNTDATVPAQTHDDFAVVVTDTDGDKASSTLVISIVDDAPTARPDTDSTTAGHTETGNVITGVGTTSGATGKDTVGADNAHATAIASNNIPANTDNVPDGSNNFQVVGQFGTLTLNADGSYSYHANSNVTGTDVFKYTITDGDGDTSQTTLTIDVGSSAPTTENEVTQVLESALDLTKDGNDLVAGNVTGSNPGSTGETVQGNLAHGDPDGATITSINGVSAAGGFIDVDTGHGLLHVN